MKNNLNDIEDNRMFNDIDFNRNEIKDTDETFFNEENCNNNNEISLDLDNSENSVSSDKLDLCDKSMEEEMNKVTLNDNNANKKTKRRISKNELNTTPLPIFECLYCAGEKVAFNHLINEEFSLKYLYNTEKKDIFLIDFLQKNNLLSYNNKKNLDILKKKNININKLKNIIRVLLDNTEYLSKYYDINESENILKHKRKRDNYDINNINTKFIKIKKNNKFQFNYELKKYGNEKNELFEEDVDDNIINDDGLDNDNDNIDSFKKINELKNKIIENENKELDKDNKLNKSIEEKFCDSFNKLLEDECSMDLSRKIKWSDIDFESKPYNIWDVNTIDNNIIESDNE
jgi:hypothetical protein